MELKTSEQRYREFLDTLPLSTLRILGRHVGVASASSCHKSALTDEIVAILTGKVQPRRRSNRGAPAKQTYIDPVIFEKLNEIKARGDDDVRRRQTILEVAAPGEDTRIAFDEPVYTGILEITSGGYGFVRVHNCQPSYTGEDVFLPAPFIHAASLREGDFIACTARPSQKHEAASVVELLSVNGIPQGKYNHRPTFDSLTATYPVEKIALSSGVNDLSLRMLDMFVPIGKGQRALIIAPPKAGKTTLLKSIARAICEKHEEIALIVLLIDERPEEVTDIRSEVRDDATVIYSTFDEGAEHHVRAAHLSLEHAKRLVEHGKDVVILLDSLTKLTRAWNLISENSGKVLSGGLDPAALVEPKRFFGAARNTKEAGSLTILATALVETGSRMDDVIYEEFKGTGNADIFLSRELAERRIFPAIDLQRSGTRKEELLLSPAESEAIGSLRKRGLTDTAALLDMLRRTSDNADFLSRLPEWLRSIK